MADRKNCLHYWICKSNTKGSLVSIFFGKGAAKCLYFTDDSEYVHLPCKVNAHIFVIPTKENRLEKITEMKVKGFAIGKPCNVANCFRVRGTSALFQPSFEEFGKTVFLTCEEAERALSVKGA